jgi:alkylation response protein AidB-like acyl-CoA dehydrogenase
MRGTVSPSVSFEDCFVTGEDLLGEPGQADEAAVGLAFGLGYAAIYVGAAQRALDFTIEYCQSHKFEPDPTPLSHSLVAQRHVAEMAMALDAARLALYQSASRWQDSGTRGRAVLAARAKYLATEAALMVTSKAVQTVGGRSAHRHYPLERLFRDVRTSTLMPPNADRSLEIVGTDALGVEDRLLSARYAL